MRKLAVAPHFQSATTRMARSPQDILARAPRAKKKWADNVDLDMEEVIAGLAAPSPPVGH